MTDVKDQGENMKIRNRCILFAVLLGIFILGFDVSGALAQSSEECTTMPDMYALNEGSSGMIVAILTQIQILLKEVGDNLFNQITDSDIYKDTLQAVLLLVVIFYGTMIVLDLKQFRPGEILMMLVKMGVIVTIASPGGWEFFSDTIGAILWGTAVELIDIFTGSAISATQGSVISVDILNPTDLAAPLHALNAAVARVFSAHFWITIGGVFFTSSYGPIIAILLIWGGINFVMALFGALFTYIKTMVGLWFMFSLAPIFLILLLFQRTARLFDGWISIMFGLVLELVLLFAFLSFFIVVVTASLQNILLVEWCKEPTFKIMGITVLNWWKPKYKQGGTVKIDSEGHSVTGAETSAGHDTFPVELIDVMFFVLSSYITWQYTTFVGQLAGELSSSGLRMGGAGEAMRNYFRTRGWGGDQMAMRGLGWAGRKLR